MGNDVEKSNFHAARMRGKQSWRKGLKGMLRNQDTSGLHKTGEKPWNYGKKATPDQRARLQIYNLGRTPPNKGKKASLETRRKLSIAHMKKPIIASLFLLFATLHAEETHALVKNGIVQQIHVISQAEIDRRGQSADYIPDVDSNGVVQGKNRAGIGFEVHGKDFSEWKPYEDWVFEPSVCKYFAPIPEPSNDVPKEPYRWQATNPAAGVAVGSWTKDKTKWTEPKPCPVDASKPQVPAAESSSTSNTVKGIGAAAIAAALGYAAYRKRKKIPPSMLLIAAFVTALNLQTAPAYAAGPTDVSGGSARVTTGGFTYTELLASGTFTVSGNGDIEVLLAAGGASGGSFYGGGGGAGGLLYHAAKGVTDTQTLTVTIGAGAAGRNNLNGLNGSNSVCDTMTAVGGGAGGNFTTNGVAGGSGGGAGISGTGGSATQADSGGASSFKNAGGNGGAASTSGGGGGSNAAGVNGNDGTLVTGDGGAGKTYWAGDGSSLQLAAGGGSAVYPIDEGVGGAGGGGNGHQTATAGAGTANTGSGGGGTGDCCALTSGAGGSGRCVIRWAAGGAVDESKFFQMFGYWDRNYLPKVA